MRTLSDKITISNADGTGEKPYPLLSWEETPDSDDAGASGDKVRHVRRFWGGGLGETVELARGGYYYSENAYHGDPFALKPRPTIGTVVLTGNAIPVTELFEVASASTAKYLYGLAGTKVFKVRLTDRTLVNTRDLTGATVNFKTGAYVGTGAALSITGLGFGPDAVVIKPEVDDDPAIRVTGMTNTKMWLGATLATGISSLDTDGFTLGAANYLNVLGRTYFWMAWEESAGTVHVDHYDGDGNATQAVVMDDAFQPDLLWIWDEADALNDAEVVSRHSTHGANETVVYHDAGTSAACVSTLNANGFTVNNDVRVNTIAHTYWYIAFKALAGFLTVGVTDNGTGVGRTLTDAQLTPDVEYVSEYVIMSRYGTSQSVHRSNYNSGDSTMYFSLTANAADLIESLDVDGWTVGTLANVNAVGIPYHFAAFKSMGSLTPVFGQPAEWNSIWEIPKGALVPWVGLTTIVDGVGNDTYTTRAGLYATHFCTLGQKLARADENAKIRLCSADDVSVAGNWGAAYPVQHAEWEITRLVEWSDELGVCATDGMYMFDGVAFTRQQLPLLGGLKDDDNGKGTIRMASFIFYPSADGLWRWAYGSHKRVDPDADRYYVKAAETSNEPMNLKHYGSAFCGDHIYHAAYGGGKYLLMHGKLNEEGEFVWDCLLSTTTEIKVLYLDSNHYLWFNYGNNLAYIVLSQGGEADGGTFGNASLVTTIYSREIVLAEDAECRLRMVKVITRNMPGATFAWGVWASLDGGVFNLIGATITADGVNKRYFPPASNLTARRIRLLYGGLATVGFVPDTTPPEIIFEGVYGETKPDDAETVKAVINLDGDRAAETVYAELKARENAGVVKVRHPINNTMLSLIIYGVALANLRQKGYEEPVAVAIVSMRRGDTA